MPLPPTTRARLAKLIEATITPQHAERARRTDNALTADGKVRGELITGTVAVPALPSLPAESIAVPGLDYDDLQSLLEALNAAVSGLATTYAPIGASYLVQTANASLTAEQALGALATGIVLVTTGTGVLSSTPTLSNYHAASGTLQGSADTASTSSTTVYSIAIDDDITLATGTWSIWSIGVVNLRNTAASSNDVKITVDGTDSPVITRAFGSANPSAAQFLVGSKASITGGAAKTVAVKYKASTTGTAEAFSCAIFSYAMRTA